MKAEPGEERTLRELLSQCARRLKSGALVCLETDTVPGLAVCAEQPEALRKLYALKGRQPMKKLVWMLKDTETLYQLAHVPQYAEYFMEKYWPGALTIVLRLKASGETQAFRFADDSFLQKLLCDINEPLAVSSANKSGERELLSLADIQKTFGPGIDFFAWRNRAMSGQASTVLDMTGKTMRILRQGELLIRNAS